MLILGTRMPGGSGVVVKYAIRNSKTEPNPVWRREEAAMYNEQTTHAHDHGGHATIMRVRIKIAVSGGSSHTLSPQSTQ